MINRLLILLIAILFVGCEAEEGSLNIQQTEINPRCREFSEA